MQLGRANLELQEGATPPQLLPNAAVGFTQPAGQVHPAGLQLHNVVQSPRSIGELHVPAPPQFEAFSIFPVLTQPAGQVHPAG
ncbi:hypothetical protein COT07_02575, partial [Candidatus Woesearchaeota archaeon CG07_land_8_20_14_0_80_44_23]